MIAHISSFSAKSADFKV